MRRRWVFVLLVAYYVPLLFFLFLVVAWILLSRNILIFIARLLLAGVPLVFVAVKFPWVFTAEFIASDPEPNGVLQHGIFPCKVLCYQVLAKYGPFNPSPLLPFVRRLYVVKRKGNVYVLVELHGFFSVLFREKERKVKSVLETVFSSCRVIECCVGTLRDKFREAKLFPRDYAKRMFYFYSIPDLSDCVIVASRDGIGVYYFSEGFFPRHMFNLKLKYEFSEVLFGALLEKVFEGSYPSQTPDSAGSGGGTVIGNRMIGDVVADECIFFKPGSHVLMVGKTGSGKTTLLANLVDCYKKMGFNVVVLDSFGELASLGREVVASVDFFVNPFEFMKPEEVLDIIEKASVLFLGEKGVFSYMVRDVIVKALNRIEGNVSLGRLIGELEKMRSSEAREDVKSGCDAAIRRLRLFYHPVFEKTSRPDMKGVFVINLSDMNSSARFFFSHILMELLYRVWDPREPLVLAIDELMPVEYVREDRVPSIVEEIAKCARKLNIVFVLGNQEYRTLPLAVRNMPEHLFVFRIIDVKELEYLSKLISGVTGRNYQDVYRELSMLREGECYYITKNYATKVKVKYYPLARVKRRTVVNEKKLEAVAREHRVSVERLRRVLALVSREDFLEALRRKDYKWLAKYNLAHVSRGKLSRLGEALAAYYSVDLSQVN